MRCVLARLQVNPCSAKQVSKENQTLYAPALQSCPTQATQQCTCVANEACMEALYWVRSNLEWRPCCNAAGIGVGMLHRPACTGVQRGGCGCGCGLVEVEWAKVSSGPCAAVETHTHTM